MTQRTAQERRRIIVNALHGLGRRPVTFKSCPTILKLVMAADGREQLEGSHRQQIIMKHERELRKLTDGLILDEKVVVVERYLDGLPGGGISQKKRSPFLDRAPMLDGWGTKE